MIKTILVPASGSDTDVSVFATALALARPLGAHLRFFHLRLSAAEAAVRAPHVDFCRGAAIADALEFLGKQSSSLAANAFVHARDFCEAHQVPFRKGPGKSEEVSASWLEETHDARDRLLFHARHSDAVVMGRTRNRDFMPLELIGTLLLDCGRPIIIAPESAPLSRLGTVVVGWKESPEAAHAMTAALPLLERAQQVILLSVAEDGAASREALDDLASQLAWHGISATVRVTPDKSGPAITQLQKAAAEEQADLLVVGGFGHGPLRERIFGGVTDSLIQAAAIPVFMVH